MHKTTWKKLDVGMRTELEALLDQPNSAFLSDFQDALAFWILALLVCVGGIGAGIWDIATDSFPVSEHLTNIIHYPTSIFLVPRNMGILAGVIIGIWVSLTIVRNHRRRGFAALSDAIVVVRGPKLTLYPHSEIVATDTLTLKNGVKRELNVNGGWAEEAVKRWATQKSDNTGA